jgi:HAD superfamily hydrolase (TIGR01509 family)
MNLSALIFDCDGVLIDSEIVVCRIAAEELTALGYTISTEDVMRRFAGRPDGEMRSEIEAEWGRALPETYRERVNARTYDAYASELKIMPGLPDALDAIDLPMCVASSSFPEKLERGLRAVGLYERFAPNIISGTLVAHGKPAPDVFLFAAGWMKTSPRECLVIEDSVAGVTAARQAGATVFGFTGGSHCKPDHADLLTSAGASLTFAKMEDLSSILRRFARQEAVGDAS